MLSSAVIVVFRSPWVQTAIISAVTKNISAKTNTEISIQRVKFKPFRSVVFEEIYMSDQNMDTLFYAQQLIANIDSVSLKNKQIILKSLEIKKPGLYIEKIDSGYHNFSFLLNYFVHDSLSVNEWRIKGDAIGLSEGFFKYSSGSLNSNVSGLLVFNDLDMKLSNIRLLPDKSYSFHINNMQFRSGSGFAIEDISCGVEYSDSTLRVDKFYAKSLFSEMLIDSISLDFDKFFNSKKIEDIKCDLDVNYLNFGFSDIAFWYSSFEDIEFAANVSGKLKGTLNDMRGRDFVLNIGDFTRLNGDFYMNGLPDIRSTYIFFDLNESFANLNEIRNLDLPAHIKEYFDSLPSFLENVGTFSYKGNFTGFIDNFVAYGTAYSNLGTLRTDVSFKPHKQETLFVNGQVSAVGLDIGSIFDNSDFDKLTFNGDLTGTLDYNSKFDLVFDGRVDSIDYRDYRFRSIDVDGDMVNDRFTGTFSISDPNIEIDFTGKLDLSPELPVFEFFANVAYANFQNLNLLPDYYAVASVYIDANFRGNNIDNIEGNLVLNNLFFQNDIDSIHISSIELNNSGGTDYRIFLLESDLIDGQINGNYSFQDIGYSLIAFYQNYLPSSYYSFKPDIFDENDFDFEFMIKNIEPLSRVFRPGLELEQNIKVSGFYRPNQSIASLNTNIPFFRLDNKTLEDLSIRFEADANQIYCRANSGKMSIGESLSVYNFTVNATGKTDVLDVDVIWNNYGTKTYSGTINTSTSFEKTNSPYPHIVTNIEPSNLYFSDSLWHINQAVITIDSSEVMFDDFAFYRESQKISIDGKIAKDEESVASINIENVELALLETFLRKSYFSGKINGNATLKNVYSKFMLDLDLSINELSFKDGLLGDLSLTSYWDNEQDVLNSQLSIIKNNQTLLGASGTIDPLHNYLDLDLGFRDTPVEILEVFLPSTFNKFGGLANGDVHLYGKTNHIMLNGKLTPVTKAQIGITHLNTVYSFSDPVYFRSDSIIFENNIVFDQYGNSGIFSGNIKHRTFNKTIYDLSIETQRVHVLNTTARENEFFYGIIFAAGNVDITGHGNDVLISGDVRSERGTVVNIPFESASSARQYDFVEFVGVDYSEEAANQYDVVVSGLNMNFDVEVTPDARVQIIFNTQMGDVIRGTGNGNMQVRVDKNYKIELYGNYIIEDGDYLFTLQNLVNKRFNIEEGSTMEWIGDPYDAIIDITAKYKLKTSLHDLFVGNYENIDMTRRIPVDCIIYLKETLNQPDISFAIDLPTAEERVKDEVGQMIVTSEDVNRQFISLLMLGRFYTPEFFAGRAASETGAELVGTTASELISNQISNWLSQISNTIDLGINYRPGNEITDDQLELAISTQILNDRISLNGNFANNANPSSNNNSEIIGDFDLLVKLTENGKLQFKAYNRSNDNLIYDTAPYTQGAGFSYREDFNTLRDLIERYKAVLSRKSKKAVPDIEADIVPTNQMNAYQIKN